MRLAQPAELPVRRFLQVVQLDAQAAGDVALDGIEPLPLLWREGDAGRAPTAGRSVRVAAKPRVPTTPPSTSANASEGV